MLEGRFSRCVLLVVAIAVASVAFALEARAADWPRWRGPNADGISVETDWNVEAVSSLTPTWKINVGEGYSAVAVVGSRLYTMGNRENTDNVSCIDVESGVILWSFTYACKVGQYPGPRATPTVDGGSVYTLSSRGHLFCLDAESGKKKWGVNVAEKFKAKPPKWGFAGSVLIDGELAIVNAGEHGMAFNKQTGEKVWVSKPSSAGYATPVVYEFEDRRCVAVFGAKAVYGIDVKTGEQIWSYPWKTKYDVNAADPIVFDNYVFLTSGYKRGATLIDITAGKPVKVWENNKLASHFSGCVLLDGYIYGISGNVGRGAVVCLDAMTGEVAWQQKLEFGSLIAAGGRLIIFTEKGQVRVAEVSPKGYRQLADGKTFSPGAARIWTPPTLANSRLYCRSSNGDLVSYKVGK